MPRFVVLPRDPQGAFDGVSAQEMQDIIERYAVWSQGLAERNRLVLGEKLVDGAGRVLRGGGGDVSVTDGPYTEGKEVIGGLWIIEADDMEHALRLTRDCPHLEYGSLEVREVEQLVGAEG